MVEYDEAVGKTGDEANWSRASVSLEIIANLEFLLVRSAPLSPLQRDYLKFIDGELSKLIETLLELRPVSLQKSGLAS